MSSKQQSKKSIEEMPEDEEQTQRQVQSKEQKEIQLQDIVHQANPQQRQRSEVPQRASQIQPPVVKNPVHFYKGHQKYNWRLEELEPTAIIQRLQVPIAQFSEELPFENDIQIQLADTPVVGAGIGKHICYVIKKNDKNGQATFARRYTEYIYFRKKLIELWPGIFIPTLPNKTLLGSSEDQVIRSRVKYIIHFWRKLSCQEKIYYSDEVKHFMDDKVNIEATLQTIDAHKIGDLLEKYKNCFPQAYQNCHSQQFMYKKDQAPVLFQEFQNYFGKKKIDLLEFKDAFLRLAQLKTKYIKAVSKLNQIILPSYQNVIFNWFNGKPVEQKSSGILDKINRKSQEIINRKSVEQPNRQSQASEQKKEQPLPVVIEQDLNKKLQFPNPLYNSEAYKSKLEDTGNLIQQYNSSVWVLYDVIKFELKDLDCVLGVLDQVKLIQKEIQYLKRSIDGNKQQLQSLNNKKTTLKIFFMGGSEDDKKGRLTAQNQAFEEKLQKTIELYHIILSLVETQLVKYHQERIQYYTKAVKKSITDQLGIARSVMDFHVFEYQLFAKQRSRKIQEIYINRNSQNLSQRGSMLVEQQIKDE